MSATLLEELLLRHPEMEEREARGRILRGDVLVDGSPATKPGVRPATGATITLKTRPRFVSRAGEKLDGALGRLGVEVRGKVMIDAGSATGGFTDCLLTRGAALVHSVDVGRGLLAWKLRNDPRVRVREGTNVLSLGPHDLIPRPQGAVCDLSFRSLRGAASHLVGITGESWLLALVKPQFEWVDPPPDFRGVVRDKADLEAILRGVEEALRLEGLEVAASCPSGLTGRRGNQEFFYLIRRPVR